MTNSPATTSLHCSNFYVDFESDIVDGRFEFDDEPERYEIHPRPASRLGFNRTMLDSPRHMQEASCDRFVSRTHIWEQDPGPNLEDTDMETISPPPSNLSSSSPSASEVDDPGVNEDTDIELDSDCSAYDDSDEDAETFLFPPLPQHFTPIPFPISQSEHPEWTTSRPQFSCLPSPLSPRHTVARAFSFHHTPSRHSYHQHGYSRQALLHLKWFWATREDTLMDPQARLRDAKAYGGLSILGMEPSPFRGHAVPDDAPPNVAGQLPPMSVHPRLGDLSALRDPYCMHIDRYFVGLPLWTMAKTLWMFDVHIGVSAKEQSESTEGVASLGPEEDDARSEIGSLDTPASLNFSDDSDTTLVESDSDNDTSAYRSSCAKGGNSLLQESGGTQGGEGRSSPGDLVSPYEEKESSRGSHKRLRTAQTQVYHKSRSQSPDSARPPWTTSWYRRWDLLMHLVGHDQESIAVADDLDDTPPVAGRKTPKFFIGEGDESEIAEAESEGEDENDDLEDILIMVNPLH